MIMNVDFDFTQRRYSYNYFGVFDILAVLGGFRASIVPIVGVFMPLIYLHFLWSLAGIISTKIETEQENELVKLI